MIHRHHSMQRFAGGMAADKQAWEWGVAGIFSEYAGNIRFADFSLKHPLNGMSTENYFLTLQHAVILHDSARRNKEGVISCMRRCVFPGPVAKVKHRGPGSAIISMAGAGE